MREQWTLVPMKYGYQLIHRELTFAVVAEKNEMFGQILVSLLNENEVQICEICRRGISIEGECLCRMTK